VRFGNQGAVAPDAIDDPVACRRYEPCARVLRSATARPLLRRYGESFLSGFLGEVEVAAEADQGS
jgi:hypothetical protein